MVSTPHIGAATEEAQAKAGRDIASEILAALNGEPLRWKVV
jgi:D-3-phosphoglycerate dehydrogenase